MSLTLDRVEIESVGANPVDLAQAVLAQLPGLNGPVPIHEIALALDIDEIAVKPLHSMEACLQCDDLKSRGQIVVREQSAPRRRRYSVGHELGHFLNERHRPIDAAMFQCTLDDMGGPKRSGRHQQQELEANIFAIELLTPRHMLTRYLNGNSPSSC